MFLSAICWATCCLDNYTPIYLARPRDGSLDHLELQEDGHDQLAIPTNSLGNDRICGKLRHWHRCAALAMCSASHTLEHTSIGLRKRSKIRIGREPTVEVIQRKAVIIHDLHRARSCSRLQIYRHGTIRAVLRRGKIQCRVAVCQSTG